MPSKRSHGEGTLRHRSDGRSDSYISKARGMLYQIFQKVEANDLVRRNPVRLAEKMRATGTAKRKEAFTTAEVAHLMKVLPDDRMGLSIRLLLGTGMRMQELLALEPQFIEEDGSVIHIRQAVKVVKGTVSIGSPKSKDSIRDIPVPLNVRPCAIKLRDTANLYFSQGTIQSIIQSGMDVCPLVLGMIFILMLGDIDVSVASIMIFSSMATGLCCSAGLPAFAGVIAGIAAGALCGAFNGFLIAYVGMPAVIVTIASSMLFRGIVKIILDVNVLKEFPSFYTSVAWTNILGIPIALLLFFAMASVFVFVLHKSKFGRKLYIIGNNPTCAQYSGIDVKKTKMTVFILMGVMCGIASIFFVGRMGGSVSSTMGTGYEMTAIAICVLGGVSTNGGKGKVYGPVIATLIMAFLTYTLGLLDVDANTRKIVTGLILIIAVLIPSLNRELLASLKLKFIYKGNKNVEALNIRTAEEIKVLKRNLESLKQDTSLEQAEKAAKMEKIEKNITNLQKKCKEQTDIWIKEQQEDEKRAKARFAAK